MLKMGFCITGSFCSMKDMLDVLKKLNEHYEMEVFMTPSVAQLDTRFFTASELKKAIHEIIASEIHISIQEAEIYGPKKKLDIVVVYPCDGSTLSKLAYGINDNAVTMLIKSSLRNQVPIVLGVYSNDVLSNSGKNVIELMSRKHYYFVPMYQDDYIQKPNSMIACKNKVEKTVKMALQSKQYQPFILGYKEIMK